MQGTPPAEVRSASAVSLRVLISFLVLFGAMLYRVVGLPHAPDLAIELPDSASLEAMLRSSRPPLDGAMYVVGMAGWAVWVWLVVSLLLQLAVAMGERLATGTAAIR